MSARMILPEKMHNNQCVHPQINWISFTTISFFSFINSYRISTLYTSNFRYVIYYIISLEMGCFIILINN